MIKDKELRDLFKVECFEHLQKLSDGLLLLEKDPRDKTTLDDVFREAHSLKGAARMIGVSGVEIIGHRIEDILRDATKEKTVLSSETIDRIYLGLDAIKGFVNEAVTGEATGLDVQDILDSIAECGVHSTGKKTEPVIKSPEISMDEAKTGIQGFELSITDSSKDSDFKIETVRVDTRLLDLLMTQAGELTVTQTHIKRRLQETEDILELWENLSGKIQNSEAGMLIHDPSLKPAIEKMGLLLNQLKTEASDDSTRLDFVSSRLGDGIQKIRLIPLSAIFSLYPRMVRDTAKEKEKEVNLIAEGGDTTVDKRIIEEMKDPLMHMIRNSIDHGIEGPEERKRIGKPAKGTVMLRAYQTASNIFIEVSDDGKGLDTGAIKQAALKRKISTEEDLAAMTPLQIQFLIFASGLSTSSFITDISGRGVGLDVVRVNVERLKGKIEVDSTPGSGCRFRIQIPVTLATMQVLIALSAGSHYAIPAEYVERMLTVSPGDIFTIAGKRTINLDGQPVSIADLKDVLQIADIKPKTRHPESETEKSPCVILSLNSERAGFLVDGLLDEQEVVLKPHSAILKRVRNVSGATILATGEVCIVLNPHDLLRSVKRLETAALPEKSTEEEAKRKAILLAEDSITTRTQEKRILEGAGYDVTIAVDGLNAWGKLNTQSFDAVVSDVLMPNMDGLTLTEKIRREKRFRELPVILVTTLASDEDRKKGMEAGANAYIVKPAFDQKTFLETLKRLI